MSHARKSPIVIDMPPLMENVPAPGVEGAAWIEPALFYGMLVLLMSGPLAFGSTGVSAEFAQRTMALALIGLWAAKAYFQRSVELAANPIYLPACTFTILVLIQFVAGATAYRYATLSEALNLLPCAVLILVAGEMFTRRYRLRQFVLAMSIFGFAVAVFAIVQNLANTDRIYWRVAADGVSSAIYGPYPNHNHYAGLMEMLTPLAATLAFLEHGGKRLLLLFATIIMALSVVFSRSRGGMLGLAIAIVFVCAVLYRGHRQHRAAFSLLAISAVVAVLAIFLGDDKILQRLTDSQDNYRFAIYRDCLRMWLDRPLFGFGWGTFSTVYPSYRSFFTNLMVNHAHNDYLELLVETGVAGACVAAWFLLRLLGGALTKLLDRKDQEGSVLTLGLLTGIVAILAHSALDFNLRIPANAALFFVLCSAVATPFQRRIRQFGFVPRRDGERQPVSVGGRV